MYLKYAQHINADEFVQKWVKTTLKNHLEKETPSTEEVEHILDYMVATGDKISKMSYKEAKSNADKWMKAQQKKGNGIIELPEDTEVVLDFKDGFKIVKLVGENAYKREGFLMSHCVASYFGRDVEIYSLRDKDNIPHATMEKDQQIKGKGNGDIHPKYIDYVVKFLEHVGMTVGDSEMKHLGYVNIESIIDDIDVKKIEKEIFHDKYFPIKKKDLIVDKDGNKKEDLSMLDIFSLIEETEDSIKVAWDIPLLVSASIEWITKRTKTLVALKDEEIKSGGDNSKLAGGYNSKLAGGDNSKLAGGDYSQLAGGDYSQLAGGDNSKLAGGYNSQLAGGDNSKLAGGYNSQLAGGDNSQLAGGYNSQLAGGDNSQLAGGDNSKLAGGYNSQLAGGDNSKLAGGYNSKLAGGDNSKLAGGYYSMLAGGDNSKLAGGDYSQLAGGDDSKLAGGDYSMLAGGDDSKLEIGADGIAVGDDGSQAKGKIGAVIVLIERNDDSKITCVKAVEIDGEKVKEDTWYKLERGEFVKV